MDGVEDGLNEGDAGITVGDRIDGWELGDEDGSEVSLVIGQRSMLGNSDMVGERKVGMNVGVSVIEASDGDDDGDALGASVTERTVLFKT